MNKELQNMMISVQKELERSIEKLNELENRMTIVRRTMDENGPGADDFARLYDVLRNESMKIRENIALLQRKREDLDYRLSDNQERMESIRAYSTAARVSKSFAWEDGDVKTLCVGADGRSMVVFENVAEVQETIVQVCIDMPDGMVQIATYKPRDGANFVMVDDLIPRLPYQYRVVQFLDDERFESGYHQLRFR